MTVSELLTLLAELVESGEVEEDSEVRIAHQPHWPLEYSVQKLSVQRSGQEDIDEIKELMATTPREDWPHDAHEQLQQLREQQAVVWIVEGSQLGYASRSHWDD